MHICKNTNMGTHECIWQDSVIYDDFSAVKHNISVNYTDDIGYGHCVWITQSLVQALGILMTDGKLQLRKAGDGFQMWTIPT